MPKYFIKPDFFITIESDAPLSQAEATKGARFFFENELVPHLKKFFNSENKNQNRIKMRKLPKEVNSIEFNFCNLLEMMKFRSKLK
jgi:hypothetical protein